MKLSSNYYFFILALQTVLTFSFATEDNVKENILTSSSNDRQRRDLGDFETADAEKRQREFIGKRLREFVGKRSDLGGYVLNSEDEDSGTDYNTLEKRLREFVGKRSSQDGDLEKRMREFIGKRDFEQDEKRQREFVGKRSGYDGDEFENTLDKRMRDFIGKRFVPEDSYLVKRLRDFVGKRFTPEDIYRMSRRHRLLLQRPVYRRELIGK